MALTWLKRHQPLSPQGLYHEGNPREFLQWAEAGLGWLLFSSTHGFLLRAPESELPWLNGATYLGIDPDWPGLLVPTLWSPQHDRRPLFLQAIQRQGWSGAQALLPPNRLLSLTRADL